MEFERIEVDLRTMPVENRRPNTMRTVPDQVGILRLGEHIGLIQAGTMTSVDVLADAMREGATTDAKQGIIMSPEEAMVLGRELIRTAVEVGLKDL